MYEFLRGPMIWVTVILFILGLCYRLYSLVNATRPIADSTIYKNDLTPYNTNESKFTKVRIFLRHLTFQQTFIRKDPVFFLLTMVFHVLIVLIPLGAQGHAVLFFQSWHVSLPDLSGYTTNILTIAFLICTVLLLLRRFILSHVFYITSFSVIALMAVTIAPFITGFFAYNQIGPYEPMIIIHMVSGHMLIISLAWTRLGHMLFMLFSRFFVRSEYSFSQASRQWS